MTYNNCLIGALQLWWRFGGRIVRINPWWDPHFMVLANRRWYHFVSDKKKPWMLFDGEIGTWLFRGQYVWQERLARKGRKSDTTPERCVRHAIRLRA